MIWPLQEVPIPPCFEEDNEACEVCFFSARLLATLMMIRKKLGDSAVSFSEFVVNSSYYRQQCREQHGEQFELMVRERMMQITIDLIEHNALEQIKQNN